jgi:FAD/FMN-containing dehydrogenase/Fe-S oxidoreductase
MLPLISPESNLKTEYADYLKELKLSVFSGDINSDYATRLSMAVDNSIYQVIPQFVVFPHSTQDIVILLTLANKEKFHGIQFCARGGGTSTNGQSLTAGIIVDCSRYMRSILEINIKERWARVQPGVVLDQLNQVLRADGFCFAPEISPSNRATIGGMVNTDASGTGSKILGRTSDHIIDLTCVLRDGTILQSSDSNTVFHASVMQLLAPHLSTINEKFTSAPRTLNGYNLKKAFEKNLNYLFSGSEGTLAIISECKLKLTPLPNYRKLVVLKYKSFDDALRAVELTEDFKPLAIEAIDEKLIELARQDSLYFYIKDFIDGEHAETQAINLVEFVADTEDELNTIIQRFCNALDEHVNLPRHAIGYYLTKNAAEAKLLWELRKKSVGLISKKLDGTRRPIPFIEDTAVPPEHLADYIAEFRALLDSYHLLYGMYGHVDAGCVHVRPALDMKLAQDKTLMQELTYKVISLIKKYHGVLWGEHGHGYRSEFGEAFFGKELYQVVREIKTLFDPYNQLNPGKIATAINTEQSLVGINDVMRGDFDKQISPEIQAEFADTITCNGNGACFNYATADVMCPSYKVTHDRIHSPKGRATVMREWLRQLANKKISIDMNKNGKFFHKLKNTLFQSKHASSQSDFSNEVYSAMAGCLSCKGCASQCPLNVDVPEFKAKFLALYHQRYLRPLRDYFIASLEWIASLQVKFPKISNALLNNTSMTNLIKSVLRLVDVPSVSTISLKKELKKRNVIELNIDKLKQLPQDKAEKSVILLQDTFSSFYEPTLLLCIYDFLTKLGFVVYIAPFFASGKPQHVKGFLRKFNQLAKKNSDYLQKLALLKIPLVGIDPSITLTYRDEYKKVMPTTQFNVMLIQEWLAKQLPKLSLAPINIIKSYFLISHCTEKTMCVESEALWKSIFLAFGLELQTLAAGCCGMAGSYGHEIEHVTNSQLLFSMDWQSYVEKHSTMLLATGYSCRSQVKRCMEMQLKHPMEVLAEALR